jgi:hypothetical protein
MKKILFTFLMTISLSSCVTINYISYDDTEQEQIAEIKSDTVKVQHNFIKNFINGKIVYSVKVNNETYYYDETGRLLYKTSQPD